jgi:type I restriction enzyme, S subunit
MIDELKPYPEYKDSGHPWIGSVPQHWPVLPNRAIFNEVKDRDHPDEEMLSVTITRGIVRQKALLADTSKKDSSNQNRTAYKLVQPQDIAYNKMRAWQGAIGVSDLRGIISPAYVVMRLRTRQQPRYFHHVYRTPQFAKEAERWSYGITSDMWSLRPEHFKMIYTPIPPLDEQAAIVRFLDHSNTRIERAIRAKRKLITLLNEKKHAIIHRAVTRGLDPAVKLKPSGIDWLGDVPENWDILPVYVMYNAVLGKMLDTKRITGEHSIPYLRNADVNWDTINTSNLPTFDLEPGERERFTLRSGDIVICEGGAGVGQTAIWRGELAECAFQKALHRLRPRTSRQNPRFFYYCMRFFIGTGIFEVATGGSTIPHLTGKALRLSRFPCPPRVEQDEIVGELDEQARKIDSVIARTECEIALLREYRTTLTAEVVTGKLDVRVAAKRLPAASLEPLPVNEPSDDEELNDEIPEAAE